MVYEIDVFYIILLTLHVQDCLWERLLTKWIRLRKLKSALKTIRSCLFCVISIMTADGGLVTQGSRASSAAIWTLSSRNVCTMHGADWLINSNICLSLLQNDVLIHFWKVRGIFIYLWHKIIWLHYKCDLWHTNWIPEMCSMLYENFKRKKTERGTSEI